MRRDAAAPVEVGSASISTLKMKNGDSSTAASAWRMPSVGVAATVRAVVTGFIRLWSSSAVTGRLQARRANALSTVCAQVSPPVSMLHVTTRCRRVASP